MRRSEILLALQTRVSCSKRSKGPQALGATEERAEKWDGGQLSEVAEEKCGEKRKRKWSSLSPCWVVIELSRLA